MRIGIGNDHVSVNMKAEIKKYMESLGHTVIDYGADSSARTDYPIYGKKVAEAVLNGQIDRGVLICGTGVGISLAANKVKGIRAGVCSEPYTASLIVKHNNAQIVAFGARVVGIELAKMIVKSFLDSTYEGGRHQRRLDMITNIENGEDF